MIAIRAANVFPLLAVKLLPWRIANAAKLAYVNRFT